MRKLTWKITGKFGKDDPKVISSPESLVEQLPALRKTFKGLEESAVEQFWVLLLDAKNAPIAVQICAIGTVNACPVHPRDIFKGAVAANAVAMIIAHNHPSGNCKFSQEDIALTSRVVNAGHVLGIRILDHVVMCADGVTSMRGEGWHDFRPSAAAASVLEKISEAPAPEIYYAHVGWPKDDIFDVCRGTKAACSRWLKEKRKELGDANVPVARLMPADEAERIVIDGHHPFRPSQTKVVGESDVQYETGPEVVELPR